jgi:polysaccharide biosynthesis transport protein
LSKVGLASSVDEVSVTEDYLKSASNKGLGYGQLFSLLLRRSPWVIGTLVLAIAASTLATLLIKPTYRSSMQLLVEPNYQSGQRSLTEGKDQPSFQSDRQNEIDYATQLNLMRSYQFMEQAIDVLRDEYPTLSLKEVREKLSLHQLEENKIETKIFEVVYTDSDPVKAQRMLEVFRAIYQDYNLKQQKLRLNKGLVLINEQLDTVRQQLASSQGQLEQFRKDQNLIDPEQQATAVTDALNKVMQEQREVITQYSDAQAKYASLQTQLARSPQNALVASRLSQSTRYQELLNQLQKTELELAKTQVTYTDANPRVRSLMEQRQKQLELLSQEVGRILGNQVIPSGESLLQNGQLGETDLTLAQSLTETQSALASLSARSRSLAESERQLRQELNRYPSLIAKYDRLQPEVEIQRTMMQQLLEERQKLGSDLAQGGFNWEIVEAPQPGEKTSPKPLQNLLLGIVAGLVLGAIAAFTREAVDHTIRSLDDLKKQVREPVLGTLPEMAASRSLFQLAPTVSTVQALMHPSMRESLDLIYKNVQIQHPGRPLKSVLVTSALPEEGKTALVLGLAFSAARSHQRVLVIDANFRQPSIHQALGLSNQQGLSLAILEKANLAEEFMHHLTVADAAVDVLTAGPPPSDPMRLLSSQRFRDLMATFSDYYDLILVDAPAVGLVDAMQVGSSCSGVLLVARLHHITRPTLTDAIATLTPLNLLGVVVNGVKFSPVSSPSRTVEGRILLPAQPTLGEQNRLPQGIQPR